MLFEIFNVSFANVLTLRNVKNRWNESIKTNGKGLNKPFFGTLSVMNAESRFIEGAVVVRG